MKIRVRIKYEPSKMLELGTESIAFVSSASKNASSFSKLLMKSLSAL
jgi:hypothetical protein